MLSQFVYAACEPSTQETLYHVTPHARGIQPLRTRCARFIILLLYYQQDAYIVNHL